MGNERIIPDALVESTEVLLFAGFILLFFAALIVLSVASYWLNNPKRSRCPYTGRSLWLGENVPLWSVEKIMRFLYYDIHSYDNRVFPMKRALFCRDTGRIFPYCVSWWGYSIVGWDFLQKRCPGNWVSWGSLTTEMQRELREAHRSLEGFQTEFSSPAPSPRAIEEKYIYVKPGPLYVDLETYTLLGWKCVPGTKFEVLIVQRCLSKLKRSYP